ncbi:MAG TPA: MBL fold metallo-hydrolase [Phycisphaerales bacterium]|nr:MBL fold metallo-hydrolase [Phycisphaerales bacterium]
MHAAALLLSVLWSVFFLPSAPAPADPQLTVRVVDVGAGECCVVSLPDGQFIVYDAGNFQDKGRSAMRAINEIIPDGSEIALLVLSHSDADHLGAVPAICEQYAVRRVIRGGTGHSATWLAADAAIAEEREEGCHDINLASVMLPPGSTFKYGDVFVTVVCGFDRPPADWDIRGDAEAKNAGSIVVRMEYRGRSVLFCGDSVGRHNDDPTDTLIAAEKFMVEMSPVVKLQSDAMIAPHHGADNGSSTAFIRAVSPSFVVFCAGHKTQFQHPRATTVQRYLNAGVDVRRIFRTDLGDDDGPKEWDVGRIPGASDPIGDDDVEITIANNGEMTVQYTNQQE